MFTLITKNSQWFSWPQLLGKWWKLFLSNYLYHRLFIFLSEWKRDGKLDPKLFVSFEWFDGEFSQFGVVCLLPWMFKLETLTLWDQQCSEFHLTSLSLAELIADLRYSSMVRPFRVPIIRLPLQQNPTALTEFTVSFPSQTPVWWLSAMVWLMFDQQCWCSLDRL